jgi:hypothetical protein
MNRHCSRWRNNPPHATHRTRSRLGSHAGCCVRDLCGDDTLLLTQDSLPQLIGVQRNAISIVAHALQRAGIIRYRRGYIDIINPRGLRERPASAMTSSTSSALVEDFVLRPCIEAPARKPEHLVVTPRCSARRSGAGECTHMPIFLANDACRAHALRQIPCISVGGIGDRLHSSEEGGFFGLSPSFAQRILVGARRR